MAKNAGQTVQALLARAPAPPRVPAPVPSSSPATQPGLQAHDHHVDQAQADTGHAAPAPAVPVIAARSLRRRSPASVEPSASAESRVPPTLRLSQPIAQALRTAWLAAKRDRVLLTYQDFAGEITATGLRGGPGAAAAQGLLAAEGPPAPRTLRLAFPTAHALRTAWLAAKRDRVLLTYQDFAGEITATGLRGGPGAAAAQGLLAAEGPPAPRTLRLAFPTAHALRTAWLAAKRDRVLLTYQDFAGEIIATGLWQRHANNHG